MRFLLGCSFLLCPFLALAESAEVTGELKLWHAITLTVDGPEASESGGDENPFTDYEMTVTFSHESGESSYEVPGYFAADGNAGETSATEGNKWRAHFSPDREGSWTYLVSLKSIAKEPNPDAAGSGETGTFEVGPSDKALPDFRARGRLDYISERYLRFAGDGTYFLKAGPDAPETMLGYEDFDGTRANNPKKCPLKSWTPHLGDWSEGDPTWKDGKGKGLIGALNYLSEKGLNGFSFLTYNAGGDGDNIWPFVERNDPMRYDVSKLDQWNVVFSHATAKGLHLHFKLQETENDDEKRGTNKEGVPTPTALDRGQLGPERKLYLREMIARFGHHLALNWNIGEENTQSAEVVRAMAEFIAETDAYDHNIVIHTYPSQQDQVYNQLLGDQSVLTGASLQNPWNHVHRRTKQWIEASAKAGRQWVVANDEQNPADLGVPPDPGYEGFDGIARPKEKDGKKGKDYNLEDIRHETLWGNLMAGGAGVEYYFGYRLPQNDLLCEDFRSRDKTWDYCRVALTFFEQEKIPFWEMESDDALVGNPQGKADSAWCLAKSGECYLIFLPAGASAPQLPDTVTSMPVRVFSSHTGDEIKVAEPIQWGETSFDEDRILLFR